MESSHALQEEAPDAAALARWRREFRWVVAGYAALVVFGFTIPDAVYRIEWAQGFSRAIAAIVPQIQNIQGISGARWGQNQFLFAALWILATPISAVTVLYQDVRKWRLPLLRKQPLWFLGACAFGVGLLLMAYGVVFTAFEPGASRITYLLFGRLSAALAAPFFVFGPLVAAFHSANYLVRLASANLFPHRKGPG
jgi:hypothetical protein